MSIRDKAVLVRLYLPGISGKRKASDLGDETAAAHGIDPASLESALLFIPKASVSRVTTANGRVREHFKKSTMPWDDAGGRIAASGGDDIPPPGEKTLWEIWQSDMNAALETRADVVREFCDEYAANIHQWVQALNGAAAGLRIPGADAVRDHLTGSGRDLYTVEVFGDSKDFRLAVSDAEADILQAKAEIAVEERLKAAHEGATKRLNDTIRRAIDCCGKGKTGRNVRFTEALWSDLAEIIKMLPAFDTVVNGGLTVQAEKLGTILAGLNLRDIRDDEGVRQTLRDELAELIPAPAKTAPAQASVPIPAQVKASTVPILPVQTSIADLASVWG